MSALEFFSPRLPRNNQPSGKTHPVYEVASSREPSPGIRWKSRSGRLALSSFQSAIDFGRIHLALSKDVLCNFAQQFNEGGGMCTLESVLDTAIGCIGEIR
jgi:hypothetical protein